MRKLLLLWALAAVSCFAQGGNCEDGNIGSAVVTLSASGTTVVIPAVTGYSIHICHISISWASSVNVTLNKVLTGTSTPVSGVYQSLTWMSEHFQGSLRTGLGYGFSITMSSAVTGGGVITYYLSPAS